LVGQALPPANRSGSDQELAGESACPTFFHELSRAEGPSQQTTKSDRLSHLPPNAEGHPVKGQRADET
jgi:hypothetical protein